MPVIKIGSQSHRSDPRILGRRTLERDHRILAAVLKPGYSVLDVGCGTGAITFGIAKAAGPHGHVIGVDRNEELLALARSERGALPNLLFETGDATSLNYCRQFDIVTAARVLQWIGEPAAAISKMKQAAKPNGLLVVLDYNHASNTWEPDPPREFMRFYRAFLDWREANQWDNEMADHLPELFRSAGFGAVESHVQDEVVERGEPEFAERSAIWLEVIGNVGEPLTGAGFCTASELREARECYARWVKIKLVRQTLAMRTVTGIVPSLDHSPLRLGFK